MRDLVFRSPTARDAVTRISINQRREERQMKQIIKKLIQALAFAVMFLPVYPIAYVAFAADGQVAKAPAKNPDLVRTEPGLRFSQGILCTKKEPAHDLLSVIDKQGMFFTWLNGYMVSGYCGESNANTIILEKNLHFQNVSYDGYKGELWQVRIEQGDGSAVVMYAIVFPGAANTMAGEAI